MPTITIYDLQPVGHSLFDDRESYLNELSSDDGFMVQGGTATTIYGSAVSSGQCISLSATSSPYCFVAFSLLGVGVAILIARQNK